MPIALGEATKTTAYAMTGRYKDSERVFGRNIDLCESAGDMFNLTVALQNRGILSMLIKRLDRMLGDYRRMISIARENGFGLAEMVAQKDIGEVAKRKNVVCKVSGIVASAKPGAWSADDLAPIVRHVQEAFGPDRVMFGGDWPVCTLAATYKQWVEALKTIVKGQKAEEQRKLFHDNAVKFYGLA